MPFPQAAGTVLPVREVAPLFGFSSAKHFVRRIAPEIGLSPVKHGNRWYFDRDAVNRTLVGLTCMSAGRDEAEAKSRVARGRVRCIRADEVAARFGYSPHYFRSCVAPKLGLRPAKVGKGYWFVADSVDAIVQARAKTLSHINPQAFPVAR